MSDLVVATRELFVRSVKNQVFMRTPFFDELQKRNQITFSGGRYIERLVDTDEIDNLVQAYTTNEALTDEKKNTLDKPRFTFKLAQIPLRYDVDEELQNHTAAKDAQLLDLAAHLVKKGQIGLKLALMKMVFNSYPTVSTTGVADNSKYFQSLLSALDRDVTYGTITRSLSAGTNDWWQGADPAGLVASIGSTSSQDTAYNLSISNLRKWISETDVAHYMEEPSDLLVLMCPTLFNKLRAEMEAKVQYQPTGNTQKQGFDDMELDGHRIVSVPFLQQSSTTKTWVFILNMNDWELRIHTSRNFKMTPFKWQAENANGYDYYLSRILVAGNVVCWKPNGSLWLSAVS